MYFEGDGFDTCELKADEDFMQKSYGAFAPQLGFHSNDPYRDTNDAVRGVAMGQSDWQAPLSKSFGFSSSDFYDDDDVVRGCSMAHAPGQGSLFGKPMEDGLGGGFFGMPHSLGQGFKEDENSYSSIQYPSLALEGSTCPLRFQRGDVPPEAPITEHFEFEKTTAFITTSAVDKVANGILDFLESQVVASILKVRQQKFSVKVDIFLEHIMCTMKIRVWKVASKQDHYAIEFQRRLGDPFAFGNAYRQCVEFLSSQFPGISGDTEQQRSMLPPSPPPPPATEGNRSDEELDAELFSLLDMASMTQCPNLQAEAASALAKLACDDLCVAKYLSKVEVLDQFLPLLSCDAVDVLYPTARMLSAVAANATTSLAEHSISKVVIEKISDPRSKQLVRLELAKAVSAAFHCRPHLITAAQAQELRGLLESTMQDLKDEPAMDLVSSTLQDVLLELNPYCYPACSN